MNKKRLTIFMLVLLGGVAFVFFYFVSPLKFRTAALLVEAKPVSIVYVDGKRVGRTPYHGEFKDQEIVLKIVPENSQLEALFQTKVSLSNGVETIVRRIFREDGESFGEIVSFEKTAERYASLSVISKPDRARTMIDDQVVGFTPVKIIGVDHGQHKLTLTADKYNDRRFSVVVMGGYKLTAEVDLEKKETEKNETFDKEGGLPSSPIVIEVLDTPTGFLRVRGEPRVESLEIGRVNPKERYEVLEKDTDTGWSRIEFEKDISGWVSPEYTQEIETPP